MPHTTSELSTMLTETQQHHALLAFTIEEAELYKKLLHTFRSAIAKGDSEQSQQTLLTFSSAFPFDFLETLNNCQNFLIYFNTICQLQLLETDVHPSYTLKLYDNISQKILALTDRKQTISLAKDICHKYCLLIKNYTLPNYSRHIRTVISYIHLHLEEELSLRTLAALVEKNASALSSSFSKEVGMTVTQYIHQVRIEKAIFYFNTTTMPISEVALAVGMHDFAYFSRLFHKQVGCSPREYCQNLK